MNSNQRRKDKRKWKYKVAMHITSHQQYEDMWWWLAGRHGRNVVECGWRERLVYTDSWSAALDTEWEFTKEKDLIEFILRWS